jgi:hypothetical protein
MLLHPEFPQRASFGGPPSILVINNFGPGELDNEAPGESGNGKLPPGLAASSGSIRV